jgi:transposase
MPAPYSNDLRKKILEALEAVERGGKKSHVCRVFNISRNTLNLWLKHRDTTGNISPKCDSH